MSTRTAHPAAEPSVDPNAAASVFSAPGCQSYWPQEVDNARFIDENVEDLVNAVMEPHESSVKGVRCKGKDDSTQSFLLTSDAAGVETPTGDRSTDNYCVALDDDDLGSSEYQTGPQGVQDGSAPRSLGTPYRASGSNSPAYLPSDVHTKLHPSPERGQSHSNETSSAA